MRMRGIPSPSKLDQILRKMKIPSEVSKDTKRTGNPSEPTMADERRELL